MSKFFNLSHMPADKGRLSGIHQKARNRARIGRRLEDSNFGVFVSNHGLVINGDYGTNPSREETQELTALLSELLETWKARQQSVEHA